jgi:hypothetical protein
VCHIREEYRLRAFENRVLRRIFRSKRDEVIGGWGKLHNEELHNWYFSSSIIRRNSTNFREITLYSPLNVN